MNYYQPREIKTENDKPSGLWHYTVMNDRIIRPVGYCAQDCPGHANENEARKHYHAYLVDNARYDVQFAGAQYPCKICQDWTQQGAQTSQSGPFHLCKKHCNREGLLQVFPDVGDIISSW